MAGKRNLTFDMSGGAKGAKRPLGRPLDGGVRRHVRSFDGLDDASGLRKDDLPQAIVQFVGVGVPAEE